MTLALLVPGLGGQLSHDLMEQVKGQRDVPFARGLTVDDMDVTDPFAVADTVAEWARVVRQDSASHRLVVVNCAAYTAVDRAEEDEETAYAVNASGPALLAAACDKAGARLVHVSTDYVFPGDGDRPYEVGDPTGPRSAYGRTKLAGEQAVRELLPDASWLVRTSWLYGSFGSNFVKTMARLEASRETITVVDDQRGSPTCSWDLAAGLLALVRSDAAPGTFHATNRGETTWCGFARAVFEELGADPARVLATTSEEYGAPANRPRYSVLSPRAWDDAGLPPLQGWRASLAEAFQRDGDAYRTVS